MDEFDAIIKKNNPEAFKNQTVNEQSEKAVFDDDFGADFCSKIKIGDRCEIKENQVRGAIKFIGKIKTHGFGYFIGVCLDEPSGNGNGSVDGICYFQCPNKYGIFLRPNEITVGDFPEIDF